MTRRRATAHAWLGGLLMQTSVGNGDGNFQRMVGLGLGLGHRASDHT